MELNGTEKTDHTESLVSNVGKVKSVETTTVETN